MAIVSRRKFILVILFRQ